MKSLWDPNVKINFLILNKEETVKLVCIPLTLVGVSPEVGATCLMERTP